MTQPADFYQKKQAFLKELKYDLSMIIEKADDKRFDEYLVADNPDIAMYTKLIEKMTAAKMSLDFSLGNVERKMNE